MDIYPIQVEKGVKESFKNKYCFMHSPDTHTLDSFVCSEGQFASRSSWLMIQQTHLVNASDGIDSKA